MWERIIQITRNRVSLRVGVSSQNSAYISKRRTRRSIEYRKKIFDNTRPHRGDDLIKALEFENFMRDDYEK